MEKIKERKTCKWEDTGDYEYVTGCNYEYYAAGLYKLEDKLAVHWFVYCPYCGKKIEHLTTRRSR